MPYEPLVYTYLEDALSECVKYHGKLDSLLRAAGLSTQDLKSIRDNAERRRFDTNQTYSKAPKRYVVQEFINWHLTRPNTDPIIGQLITMLLKGQFSEASPEAIAAIDALRELIEINRSQSSASKEPKSDADTCERDISSRKAEAEIIARTHLQLKLTGLAGMEDAQRRGYELEIFLFEFFTHYGLKPRKPFRNLGEQIDGSIEWRDRIYLVKAKWTKHKVDGGLFGSFQYKIEGKGEDTRGIFISVNGYSEEALRNLTMKGRLRFICLDGSHVFRALQKSDGLDTILRAAWRHANETGSAYLPVNLMGED